MKNEPPILESLLDPKLQRLDRRPALNSALIAAALLLASSQSSAVFDQWANFLFPAWEWVAAKWSWALALGLIVMALLLDRIAAGLAWVKGHLLGDGLLLAGLLVLVGVLFGCEYETGLAAKSVLGLGIWGFLFALRHERAVAPDAPQDRLHRQFLVERLAKVIVSEGRLAKIAVIGAWGSGKTVILQRLQSELVRQGRIKWRMGWVNPWGSASPEEAWAALAGAIDSALGNKPLFPRNWVDHPVLAWLAGLVPNTNLTPELVSFFSGRPSSRGALEAARSINRKIRARLNHKDERLIIFVDDMERADPVVLRGLLPVIDRLHEIEKCQFVFAIDPARVADAFGENDKNEPLTKGYLDKVFDLQIPIPTPRDADVRAMVLQKASEGSTPILAAALARIGDHIPANPRLALRFFEVAKAKEVMFLQRYSSKEVPAPQFFLSWIIETEFKGFHEAILQADASKLFNEVRLSPLMSYERPSLHQKFPDLIKLLTNKLVRDKGAAERHRLESLVGALAELSANSLDWISEFSAGLSLQWIADGHTRLEELSVSELKNVRNAWIQAAGTASIENIVREALKREDYCDEARCGEQLLAEEVSDIIAATRLATRPDAAETFFGVIAERIERLQSQFDFACDKDLAFDQKLFGEEFFYQWLECFLTVPLDEVTSAAGTNVARKREKLHLSVAERLPMQVAFTALDYKLEQEMDRPYLSGHLANPKQHEHRLRKVLVNRVTRGVVEMFRDGTLARRDVPSNLPIDKIRFFDDPARWLWLGDGGWKAELAQLEAESEKNPNVAEACADIVGYLFIHPAACEQCVGGHQNERKVLRRFAEETPEYLQFIWNSAMNLDRKSERAERLLRERKRATEAGFIEASFLDAHFPLPPHGQPEG